MLQRSDYVSVHTPLNDHTRGLLDKERIARMKPGAILINTSRGGTIASLDILADALEALRRPSQDRISKMGTLCG